MKSTKKVISILLAAAMIFAVCAMSALADGTISTNDGTTTNPDVGSLHYVNTIEAEGEMTFYPNTNTVTLKVSCFNKRHAGISDFHLYAQCYVVYSDGSDDFLTVTHNMLIDSGDSKGFTEPLSLQSDKTVESLDVEFLIWYGNNTLWEGYIVQTYSN